VNSCWKCMRYLLKIIQAAGAAIRDAPGIQKWAAGNPGELGAAAVRTFLFQGAHVETRDVYVPFCECLEQAPICGVSRNCIVDFVH